METAFAAVSFFDVPVATVEIRRRTGFWTAYGIVAAGCTFISGAFEGGDEAARLHQGFDWGSYGELRRPGRGINGASGPGPRDLHGRLFGRRTVVDQPKLQEREIRNQDPDGEVDEHRHRVLEAQHPW